MSLEYKMKDLKSSSLSNVVIHPRVNTVIFQLLFTVTFKFIDSVFNRILQRRQQLNVHTDSIYHNLCIHVIPSKVQ